MNFKGTLKQRFHREYRNLKKFCESNGLFLKSFEDANDNDICVLSECDFEIESSKSNCEETTESYFLTLHEFEKYQEFINQD